MLKNVFINAILYFSVARKLKKLSNALHKDKLTLIKVNDAKKKANTDLWDSMSGVAKLYWTKRVAQHYAALNSIREITSFMDPSCISGLCAKTTLAIVNLANVADTVNGLSKMLYKHK